MSSDSNQTDPRLARRLARDLQKEGDSDSEESTNEKDSQSKPVLPSSALASDQMEPTGTSYPTVATTGAATPAALQGSLSEYLQVLQQMGLSKAEVLAALADLQLKREAAVRQQRQPAQQRDASVPKTCSSCATILFKSCKCSSLAFFAERKWFASLAIFNNNTFNLADAFVDDCECSSCAATIAICTTTVASSSDSDFQDKASRASKLLIDSSMQFQGGLQTLPCPEQLGGITPWCGAFPCSRCGVY